MCRNHRGFIDATVALSKLGAHCLYLNTSFAGPQITDVVNREEVTGIVYDQEFGNLIADAARGRKTYLAWQDPEGGETTDAAATAEHRATALIVVPVMLQRILELPEEVRDRYDLRALRVIGVSGSALPGQLATATMDAFGDIVYNLYGSTEVAWATIATPEDLRAAPGCAGRPQRGTIVKLYDEDGREVPQGETARIFVGNEMRFEGYTGGGSKEVINGLMA